MKRIVLAALLLTACYTVKEEPLAVRACVVASMTYTPEVSGSGYQYGKHGGYTDMTVEESYGIVLTCERSTLTASGDVAKEAFPHIRIGDTLNVQSVNVWRIYDDRRQLARVEIVGLGAAQ